MSTRYRSLAAGLLAIAVHQHALAQGTDAIKLLIDQGQYWQAHNNVERANDAWQKLLRIDPNQPDAISGLGLSALTAGQPDVAAKYLAQLRKASPGSLQTLRLEQALALSQGPGKQHLADARLAAQSGDLNKAVDNYKAALSGISAPQGQVALEYYQRLAYQPEHRDEAIAGLQRLGKDSPQNMEVQMALAQALTLNTPTRVQGIERLQALSQRPDVGGEATERWKAGLTFFGEAPPKFTEPLFQAYLKAHPDDEDIKKIAANIGKAAPPAPGQAPVRAAAAPTVDPLRLRAAAGFKALDRNNLALAENEFGAVLRARPDDAEALGGMGIVRLRQEKFADARTLLTRASSRPGGARWKQALDSATYWTLFNQAQAARANGDVQTAQTLLTQAVRLNRDDPNAQNALAALLAAGGRPDLAEALYRRVIAKHPNDAEALRGAVSAMAQNGKAAQAQGILDNLTPAQRNAQKGLGALQASVSAGAAQTALRNGDPAAAEAALKVALQDDPRAPYLNADLARLYLKRGATGDARRLMQTLVTQNPDDPQSLFASAQIASESQDWNGAMKLLRSIPEGRRTPDMALLDKRAWVHSQADLASHLANAGQKMEAVRILTAIAPYAGEDMDLASVLASAYVDVGDKPRAIALMRHMMAGVARPTAAVQLQYASFLLKAGQDAELANVLRAVQTQSLSPADQAIFDNLRVLYVVRQADTLRARGDLVGAYDMLAPVLAERPNDPNTVASLARMYGAAGEYPKALALFKQLQAKNGENLGVQLGAAQMAGQMKDYSYAEQSVEKAVALAPNNPDVLTAAARIYRDDGKTGKATEYYKLALAASGGGVGAIAGVGPGDANVNGNPFVGLPGQRTQSAYASNAGAMPAPQAFPLAADASASNTFVPSPVSAAPMATGYMPPAGPPRYVADAGSVPTAGSAPYPGGYGQPQAQAFDAPASGHPQAAVPTGDQAGAARRPLTVQQELDQLLEARTPRILAGLTVREHTGASGTSQLTDVQSPTEMRYPVADGMLSVRVTPTTLNAGKVSSNYGTASQFGGGPAAALRQINGQTGSAGDQRASGVGVSVGYERKNVAVDIGSTPFGFVSPTVVGGLKITGSLGDTSGLTYQVEASRRAVTDSVLSFAGTRDARTGQTFGGVTANGVRGQIGKDFGDAGVYGYGSYQGLIGQNVESNTRAEGGVGFYKHLIREDDRQLTTGVNLSATSYDKNLSNFTYGQGGYFSPQQFYALSVPVTWSQRGNQYSYQLKGSIGLQHFKEDASPYFPNNGAMQNAANAAAAEAYAQGLTGSPSARYSGQSKTGIGYNIGAAGEYQLAPQFSVGGTLSVDNASDYRQLIGSLYARYTFDAIRGPLPLPIEPFRSPYTQ